MDIIVEWKLLNFIVLRYSKWASIFAKLFAFSNGEEDLHLEVNSGYSKCVFFFSPLGWTSLDSNHLGPCSFPIDMCELVLCLSLKKWLAYKTSRDTHNGNNTWIWKLLWIWKMAQLRHLPTLCFSAHLWIPFKLKGDTCKPPNIVYHLPWALQKRCLQKHSLPEEIGHMWNIGHTFWG